MRLVDHQSDTVLLGDRDNAGKVGHVAVHGEDPLGDDDASFTGVTSQQRIQ